MNLGWLRPTTVTGRSRLGAGVLLGAAALAGYLITWVAYPAPVIARDHAVGRMLGLPLDEAEKELREAGFKIRVEAEDQDPVIPAGHVVWQDPPPETVLQRGALVRLTPSGGPAPVTVPDVIAFDVEQARQVIEVAGFQVAHVDTVPSSAEAGIVVALHPAPGTARPPGSPVDLVVSKGPADIRVPDLVGLRQEDARDRLEARGLRVGTVTKRRAGRNPVGVVLEQRPVAGSLTPRAGRVHLVISN